MDDRGDYNSSPCTSYRRAKNLNKKFEVCDLDFRSLAGVKIVLYKTIVAGWYNTVLCKY